MLIQKMKTTFQDREDEEMSEPFSLDLECNDQRTCGEVRRKDNESTEERNEAEEATETNDCRLRNLT